MGTSAPRTATEEGDRLRPVDPIMLAALVGLMAGTVHVCVVLARRHWLHQFTWTSRDIVWMSPLGNVLILLVPAVLLALAAMVRWRFATWRLATFMLTWVALTGVGLLVRGLHWGAVLVLAFGVAFQLGVLAKARGVRWRGYMLRATSLLALIVAVSGILAHGSAASPTVESQTTPSRPNVLLVVLDAVRVKSLGAYGSPRPVTPGLDALARDGVVFERAFASAPWTLPSHAGMFTGVPASELTASWRHPFDGSFPTVAEAFREAGYATGAFVGNTFYTHHESGLARGFTVLKDFDVSLSQVVRSTTLAQTPTALGILNAKVLFDVRKAIRYFDLTERAEPENDRRLASEILHEFSQWQQSQGSRPFFAFLNLYDAHDPYSPPSPWDRRFGTNGEARYEGGIGYMDAVLDSALQHLAKRGVLDRTIVVVTSDHGEQFGEHKLHNHGNSLYLPLTHVPLIMRYPATLSPGQRVRRVVSLRDLGATLLQMSGIAGGPAVRGTSLISPPDSSGGEALTETQKTDGGGRDHPAAHGDMAALVDDSLHLILNGDGRAELYAYVRDPAEARDLARDSTYCGALRDRLARLRTQSAFARRAPATPPCEPEPAEGRAR